MAGSPNDAMMSNKQREHVVVTDYAYNDKVRVNLEKHQNSGKFTDFTIWVKNFPIQVHKNILSSGSVFFETLFKANMCEIEKQEVHIQEMDLEIVQKIVKYLYSGTIVFDLKSIKNVVAAAEYFQLKELKQQCILFMRENVEISPQNAISWLDFGCLYELKDITRRANKVIQTRFIDVAQSQEFLNLPALAVADLIDDVNIVLDSEDPILQSAINWVEYDKKERQSQFHVIVKHMHLAHCTPVYIQHVNSRYKYLVDEVKSVFLDAAMANMSTVTSRPLYPRRSYGPAENIVIYGGNIYSEEKRSTFSKFFNAVEPDVENRNCWYLNSSFEWVNFTEIPATVQGKSKSFCKTDNGIVIFGSAGNNEDQLNGVMYNASTGKMDDLKSLPKYISGPGCAVVGDSMYFLGGAGDGKPMKDVWMLSLRAQVWTRKSPMLYKVRDPIVGKHGVSIYLFGGNNKNGQSVQCYNTISDKWTLKVGLPEGMDTSGVCTVTYKESIFIVGGRQKLCMEYHIDQDAWTLHKSCGFVHIHGSAFMCQQSDEIVLTGGSSSDDKWRSLSDTIESFDLKKKGWKTWDICLPKKLNSHFAIMDRVVSK